MIPTWTKPAVPIPVQALREFIAHYGPDVAVLITAGPDIGYVYTTVGSSDVYANIAADLRNLIADRTAMIPVPTTEDLRSDHPASAPWTDSQKQALSAVHLFYEP